MKSIKIIRPLASSMILFCIGFILFHCAAFIQAGTVRQLTDTKSSSFGTDPALNDAGTRIYTGSNTNQYSNNPGYVYQVFIWDTATGNAEKKTSFPPGFEGLVSVSDDGKWMIFAATADLTGENHDRSSELFVMDMDTSALDQITSDAAVNAGSITHPIISGSGNKVVFISNTDPLATNPEHLYQIFSINRDGSVLTQLTHTDFCPT